jgi:hypothetical protein
VLTRKRLMASGYSASLERDEQPLMSQTHVQ